MEQNNENNKNLPEVVQKAEVVQKKGLNLDGPEGLMIMGVVQGLLPQIMPYIGDAMKKLDEYFGDDNKIFVMKKIGGEVKVLVIDNTKGEYEISRVEKIIDGQTQEKKMVNTFTADAGVVIDMKGTSAFVEDLLTGNFIAETKGG